ncbi:MAG: cation diffusion facilitator family transporter [Candidatus Zixiibacteriota bacterium]
MEHHHHHKTGSGSRLFFTILLNVGITVAEFIGGLLTGYLALLADAVHNLSDVAALLLAYLGEIGARRSPTKTSTYGYKRIEVITAFTSAVALVVIAIYIFYEAYRRIIALVPLSNPGLLLTIATIGLIGNILSVFLLKPAKSESLNIRAAFLHMLYDALSSLAVIIGAIIILNTGATYIDPILSIMIGIMILYSSFDVLKEATMIFMEAVPAHIDFDSVREAIKAHPKVLGVHDLHIWSLSSNSVALSCHIQLDKADYLASPVVITELSQMLVDKFNIGHSTFQPERKNCASIYDNGTNEGGCA